jgi:hypothetical protein
MLDGSLTWYELMMAAHVGVRRHVESIRQDRHDRFGFAGDGWGAHIEGAAGELAVAKATGRYWPGSVDAFDGPDVGGLQVRTRSRADFDLLVRPGDPARAIFVHVVGVAPHYRIVGWIRGGDAKRPEWLARHGDRPPAYFVPQGCLNPPESLVVPLLPEDV